MLSPVHGMPSRGQQLTVQLLILLSLSLTSFQHKAWPLKAAEHNPGGWGLKTP